MSLIYNLCSFCTCIILVYKISIIFVQKISESVTELVLSCCLFLKQMTCMWFMYTNWNVCSLISLLPFPVRPQNISITKLSGQPRFLPALAVCLWPPASQNGSSEHHRPIGRAAPPLPRVEAEFRVFLEALAGGKADAGPETMRCQFTQQMQT